MLRLASETGACFSWGRGFRHCCVAVPKSRGWGADFPWLVHVLWARRNVGGGARTPVPRAGIPVCVWALGAPLPRSVAAPLRGRALSPLRLPSSWGLSGPAAHVLWARVCGYGVQRCPRGPYSLCSSGAGSWGFAAGVSVVRGVCGRALPLPGLSALWAGCRGPSSTLAVGAGVRVSGPGAVPSACMPCGGRTPLGWWGPSLGGWPATVARGVWCQALFLPRLPALWAGRRGPEPTCCGRGRAGVGARHCPLGLHALWELRAAGVVGGCPWGGWPATVARGVWCQALSLPLPPVLWGGRPGSRDPCVPGAVACGRGDPAPAPQRAPFRAGIARCGGGGRAPPGGMPSAVARAV